MKPQSHTLFWLLLAATVAVDAVAWSQAQAEPEPRLAVVGLGALIVSQLSVVCIWSALSARTTLAAVVAPLSGIAAAVLAMPRSGWEWKDILPYYALHVALLWSALKLFERTRLWRRWSGRDASWRFSLFQLLAVTTVVALLLTSMNQSQFFRPGPGWLNAAFMAGSLCLPLAAVVFQILPLHGLQRLAAVLACAITFGAVFALFVGKMHVLYAGYHYLIEAIVLSTWLGSGRIITRGDSAVDARASTSVN